QAEMDVITRAVINVVPDRTSFLKETRWHVDVFPMRADLVRRARAALLMLFGAGVLVMLLATANVMGLFIARTPSRDTEIAVRHRLRREEHADVPHRAAARALLAAAAPHVLQ